MSAQSFLKQCQHAEYVNVANAAHMVAGDRNDIFAESVIAFLKRAAPARCTEYRAGAHHVQTLVSLRYLPNLPRRGSHPFR